MDQPLVPTLKDRVRQIRSEIDAIVDERAEAVARQNPGVPIGVIRNLLTARAGACRCEQYLEMTSGAGSQDSV
jgi:hypothetical protein